MLLALSHQLLTAYLSLELQEYGVPQGQLLYRSMFVIDLGCTSKFLTLAKKKIIIFFFTSERKNVSK